MCGIFGVINNWKTGGFSAAQQKLFYQGLFADQLRGSDATGVITVHNNGDFGIMKEAVDAYTFNGSFIDSDLDKDLFKNGVAVIGHNRAKTVGENKDENAHPFVVDKTFAMVHNGTLRQHKELADTAVDSEALAITFAKAMKGDNWKQQMEDALGKVNGAFACVWYDQERDEVCMLRNKERPLFIYRIQSTVMFGSEVGLLNWIAGRNGEKMVDNKMLAEHTLYRFDMKKTGGDYSETFLSPTVQPTPSKGYSNGTDSSKTSGRTGAIKRKAEAIQDFRGRVPLSKNAFKRVRASCIARRFSFMVDDFVEQIVDADGEVDVVMLIGASVDGAYDLCEVVHSCFAQVSLKKLGLSINDLLDPKSTLVFEGRAFDVEYEKELKAAMIKMDNVKVSHNAVLH